MSQNQTIAFIKAFLRNPTKVGAIAPSSPSLARAMVQGLKNTDQGGIIEFGPGTGPFTNEIAKILTHPSHYFAIERDPQFVAILKKRFPQLNIIQDSAEKAYQHFNDSKIQKLQAVLCGLPFASLPHTVQDAIIKTIDQLITPGVEFRTFQYVHAYPLPAAIRFRKRMAQLFGPHQKSKMILKNLPPCYVLKWTR